MSPRKHTSKRKRRKTAWRGSAPNRARISISARDRAAGKWFEKLVALQSRLRGPNGCPWDREQSHESLRKFLVEETYEVLDAMESGDPRKSIAERYTGQADYIHRFKNAVDDLVNQRWILQEDREALLLRGQQEWVEAEK